ncbi:MAG TPA: cytochrome c-type biogenesis protein CcmH [Gaiellaceae bacterium]|jgi:cytochrome c-type biogenesis protein CcmH
MRRTVLAVALLALVAVPVARASEEHPTSLEVQQELWCDDCQTTLAEASAVSYTPAAIGLIKSLIAAGEPKSEIKAKLAAEYRGHLRALPAKPEGDRATLADLEGEVMCPECNTTLDQSSSAAARQIKALISARIAAGDSKDEIKELLVAEYGPQILAAPPKEGFDLLAWLLPIFGLLGGALILGLLAWRWSRVREPVQPAGGLSPALEKRVDEELAHFDEG